MVGFRRSLTRYARGRRKEELDRVFGLPSFSRTDSNFLADIAIFIFVADTTACKTYLPPCGGLSQL